MVYLTRTHIPINVAIQRGGKVIKTYKFKLEPSPHHTEQLEWTLTLCRRLYNALLEQRIFAYKRRGVSVNYYEQKAELPLLKQEIPAYKQVQSQVLQDIVKRLDQSFQSFFQRLKRGGKAGFPRFQGEARFDSFTYPQTGFRIEDKFLRLSKIGEIRIKRHRQMEGKVKTLTIKRKNDKYYACFSCEVEPKPETTGKQVGIDLGIQHLAITSDGEFFPYHGYLRTSEKKIKRLQRTVSRRKKGSNRREKAKKQLAKAHEKIANQRRDHAHKVSRCLVDTYDLMAFEDLNILGMVKNHRLSKSVIDASWHQLKQFTSYKAAYAGKKVVSVDARNTSQQCSNCDTIVKKTLAQRIHRCPYCGYEADRDVNAAQNILKRSLEKTAS